MPPVTPPRGRPLTEAERDGIRVAVSSAFLKLRNLYARIVPVFEDYGFRPPSPGVIARDLSEKIESAIVQHCDSFSAGHKHCDLQRDGAEWEVKICKDSGLTINQSKVIRGENYIVVNYRANTQVKSVWILWNARDELFSPRQRNSNARALLRDAAGDHIETLSVADDRARVEPAPDRRTKPARMTQADLFPASRKRRKARHAR